MYVTIYSDSKADWLACSMSSVNRMLYRFPSEQRDSVQRSKWIEAVSSKDGNNSFQPKEFHKVCEEHFYTGKPSPTNIHPGTYARSRRCFQGPTMQPVSFKQITSPRSFPGTTSTGPRPMRRSNSSTR